MAPPDPETPQTVESQWRLLLRLRWPLGGVIALSFAIAQLLEALLLDKPGDQSRLLLDVLLWGLLGGMAVWLSLTWASRRERAYQAGLERSLNEQRELNRRLQRANGHLALLSEVSRRLADSASLDEILDGALAFPQRLVPARAAALLLSDPAGLIAIRTAGARADDLARLRTAFGLPGELDARRGPRVCRAAAGPIAACLELPLHDGLAPLGRIELYLDRPAELLADELELLETIASEIAEAIAGARRRSREQRAIYELERAIADERARIARDIHDGIAQSLAFRRMRVDLWLDWLESDRPRLRDELIGFKAVLREQIAELRRAIFALRPLQFDELGFAGGLNRYVVEFASQQGWDVHVDLGGVPPAPTPELEATCFRVIQEALTNVAKHAGATRVEVIVDQVDEGLRIAVRDNGRGFTPGQLANSASDRVGLRQMRERLTALRGQLTVLSQPGAGTELRAWIPF
jgi:signal transduction histidine kinase